MKPKLNCDLRNVTIHLAMRAHLPTIGEVQLKFGKPCGYEQEKANHFLYEIERADSELLILFMYARFLHNIKRKKVPDESLIQALAKHMESSMPAGETRIYVSGWRHLTYPNGDVYFGETSYD